MIRWLCVLSFVAACTENGAAKDSYEDAERGSTWQITPSTGTLVGSGVDFPGCPTFATMTAAVPSGDVTGCAAGCTCSFHFTLEDDGDIGHDYVAGAELDQQCSDGSTMSCMNIGTQWGDPIYCAWTIDPSINAYGRCSYVVTLVREQ